MKLKIKNASLLALLVLLLCGYLPQALAVAEGPEPNNPCASTQDFGQVGLPFSVEGNLDGAINPDVDFFKFKGNPGDTITIQLEGAPTQKGTLPNPYLGLFNSSCNNVRAADSFATGTATINMAVPSDGIFIIAASACCNFDFGGNGTYQLTLQTLQTATISGRVVDAITRSAIPEAQVYLLDCSSGTCFISNATTADNLGSFYFLEGFNGLLTSGNYQLVVNATFTDFISKASDIFPIAEGEKFNAGDIAVQPRVSIGAISGRVVDAVTGSPISGISDPLATINLLRCDNVLDLNLGCFSVNVVQPDSEGKFVITNDIFDGEPLLSGSYELRLSADQYNDSTKQFDVLLEGENRDLGTLTIRSFPVRLTNISPCTNTLKQGGGSCRFSVTVSNGDSKPLVGDTWSLVKIKREIFFFDDIFDTQFQLKPPQRISLQPGKSRTISYDLSLPTNSVPDGKNICVDASVSPPNSPWDRLANRTLFCLIKGQNGFRLTSREEMHRLPKR